MREEPPLVSWRDHPTWPKCTRCGDDDAIYTIGSLLWCEPCWLKSQLEQADAEIERLRAKMALQKGQTCTAIKRRDPAEEQRWYALMAEARRRGIPPEELLLLPWEELQDVGE